MTRSNADPIVIRNGPAPARRMAAHGGSVNMPYYALVHKLKPGQWVEFSPSRGLPPAKLRQYVRAVRGWVSKNEYADAVDVYIADGDVVIAKAKEDR